MVFAGRCNRLNCKIFSFQGKGGSPAWIRVAHLSEPFSRESGLTIAKVEKCVKRILLLKQLGKPLPAPECRGRRAQSSLFGH